MISARTFHAYPMTACRHQFLLSYNYAKINDVKSCDHPNPKKAIVLSCSYSYHSNIPYVDGVGFRSAVISQLLGYDMPNRGININI